MSISQAIRRLGGSAPAGSSCAGGRGERRIAVLAALVLVAAGPLPAVAQEAEILVDVTDRNGRRVEQVYEGQSVRYVVTLNRARNPSPPELGGFDDFDVALVGQQTVGSSQVVVNGRVLQDIRGGVQFVYRLTPRKTGLLRIPGPVAKVDGRTLRGPERTLEVRGAEEQDVVLLKIAADRPAVYPMQPFTVTLTVQVKALPEPHEDRSPLGVQDRPPALTIPWVVDGELADGLEPAVDWQSWLAPMQNRQGEGFSINNLGRSQVFSLFGSRPMGFQPRVSRVTRRGDGGEEVSYWQYDLPRTFVARKVGTFGFGPVTLEGTFGTRLGGPRELVGESIYALAERIEVAVRDVPAEGRPATFTGAIGRFTLQGTLEPDRAKVGDPMTLTLTLTGEGTLGSTFAPDLAAMPEIAERFKIYEATEETSGDSSRFTYALRPLDEQVTEFPAVPLSYFDVESERYVTLRTDPVPITVTAADRLSADQIVAAPGGSGAGARELEAQQKGIFANEVHLGSLRDEQVRPGRWLAALGGLAGLYLAVAVLAVRIQRLSGDKALVRRRGAAPAARSRLQQARRAIQSGRHREGVDLVEAALVHLVADTADVPDAGLTPKDVAGHLRTLGVDDELVERMVRFLGACDAGRYGASSRSAGDVLDEAEALLQETIQTLAAKKRFR